MRRMKILEDYMANFWFKKIGPKLFSVHGESRRTNNVVESWHRSLNRKLIGKKLGLWNYLGNKEKKPQIVSKLMRINFRRASEYGPYCCSGIYGSQE
jgi:hypothetical protein